MDHKQQNTSGSSTASVASTSPTQQVSSAASGIPTQQIDAKTIAQILRWKKEKEDDLVRLVDMYNLCKNVLDNPDNLYDGLIKIGKIAQAIYHNEYNPDCIRNKYGAVNELKSNREIRPEGIGFIELNHLSSALSSGTLDSKSVSEATIKSKIISDLAQLQSKILFVLHEERKLLHELEPGLASKVNSVCSTDPAPNKIDADRALKTIPDLAPHYYDRFVLKSMAEECKLAEQPLSYANVEDRYFLSRILTKVWTLFQPDELSDSYGLSQQIKETKSSRGKIVHNPQHVIQDGKENIFNQYLTDLRTKYKPIILDLLANIETQGQSFKAAPHKAPPAQSSASKTTKKGAQGKSQPQSAAVPPTASSAAPPATNAALTEEIQRDVLSNIEKIRSEIAYIRSIQNRSDIDDLKKSYIIQHAETILVEYVGKLLSEQDRTVMNKRSVTIEEANRESRKHRAKGLAHEINALDPVALMEGLHDDILPSEKDYQAIYIIGENKLSLVPRTAVLCNRIGQALMRLCFYKEAIEFFENALTDIMGSQPVSNQMLSRTRADQYKLDSMGITQPSAICIDMTKILFGVDSYELAIICNLANSLLLNGQSDIALKKINAILNQDLFQQLLQHRQSLVMFSNLNPIGAGSNLPQEFFQALSLINPRFGDKCMTIIQQIMSTPAPCVLYYPEDHIILDQFSTIYSHIAEDYFNTGEFQKAEEGYLKAITLAGSKRVHSGLMSNLAHCHLKLGNKIEAKRLAEQVIASASDDDIDKIAAKILLCYIELRNGNYQIDGEIQSIERFLEEKKGHIKDELSDRFFIYQLSISDLRLQLLAHRNANYEVIREQIENGQKIVDKLTRNPERSFTEISIFYFYVCSTLSSLIKNDQPLDNAKIIIEKAIQYFEKGKSIPGVRQLDEKTAASNLAIAISNFTINSENLPFEEKIENFNKAIKLQTDYGFVSAITKLNLSLAYFQDAEQHLTKKENSKAIPLYKAAIDTLSTVNEKELSENEKTKAEHLKVTGMSYHGLGDCTSDIGALQEAHRHYVDFLKYENHPDAEKVRSYKIQVQMKIQVLSANLVKEEFSSATEQMFKKGFLNAFKVSPPLDPIDGLIKKYNLNNNSQLELERGLRKSAANNQSADLRIFIQRVQNINAKDSNHGKTALHWAVSKNHTGCVKVLLEAGANTTVPDNDAKIPEFYTSNGEMIALLKSKVKTASTVAALN